MRMYNKFYNFTSAPGGQVTSRWRPWGDLMNNLLPGGGAGQHPWRAGPVRQAGPPRQERPRGLRLPEQPRRKGLGRGRVALQDRHLLSKAQE